MPCDNCADLTAASYRVFRGGSFVNDARSSGRPALLRYAPWNYYYYVGARCARTSL